MNSRPLVLLDVDGIVANFIEATRRAVGGDWTEDDVKTWDFSTVPGYDYALFERVWTSPGFCASIPLYEEAREGVELLAFVADIKFVTAPMPGNPTWVQERTAWLAQHFPGIPVVFQSEKWRVPGDFLVDDHVKHLWAWREHGRCDCICWDRPYNQTWTGYRVNRWRQLWAHAYMLWHRMKGH